ncbi:MAG TPA: hypothetical protein VJY64_02275 [Candidatus Onthovivens sp.]|nr:hypothetical protein [Candidatus Onthovivens sp.]
MKIRNYVKIFSMCMVGALLPIGLTSNVLVKDFNNDSSALKASSLDKKSTIFPEEGKENTDLSFIVNSINTSDLTTSVQIRINFTDAADLSKSYYLGYYGEGEEYKPGTLLFDIKTSSGKIESRSSFINKVNKNGIYDGIGDDLGAYELNTFSDIPISVGESLVDDSIRFVNCFEFLEGVKKPDFENPLFIKGDVSKLANGSRNLLDDFVKLTYNGYSSFGTYSSFEFNVENHGGELYPTLSTQTASHYKKHKEAIDKGTYYIRTRFSFGGNTFFKIEFKEELKREPLILKSIAKSHEITNNEPIVLIFNEFRAEDVANLTINDFYLNISIYNPTTGKEVARTNFSQRWGEVYTGMSDLFDSDGKLVEGKIIDNYKISFTLITLIVFAVTSIIFLGIVIPSYFYLKNKNRNDEFKRMNTKSYVKTSIMGYVFIESFILLILMAIIRWGTFNNSLVVYNPTDVFICIFGVVSIILFGYFVRYFMINIKNSIEKKKTDKLKINQDVFDDGTLFTKVQTKK